MQRNQNVLLDFFSGACYTQVKMKRATHPAGEPFDINIHIEKLPAETNRRLNMLALARGVRKAEIVRDALVEYAQRHATDIEASLHREVKGDKKR